MRHELQPPKSLRQQQVLRTVRSVEIPLLRNLEYFFLEKIRMKGWLICGPSVMALSRILNDTTGIPISQDEKIKERFEIRTGIYKPAVDKPSEVHAHLRYYTDDGYVYYIDPIYQLLWGKRDDLLGSCIIERYRTDEIDEALEQKYSLYGSKYSIHIPPSLPFDFDEYTNAANNPIEGFDSIENGRPQAFVDAIVSCIKRFNSNWKRERRTMV